LKQIASLSNSVQKITEGKYRYVLLNVWTKKAQERSKTISDLTRNDFREILQGFQAQNFKKTTIQNYFAIIKSYLQFLTAEKIILENPLIEFKLPRKEKAKIIFLNESEIKQLLQGIEQSLKKSPIDPCQELFLILMPIVSGLRVSELCRLNLKTFNMDEKSEEKGSITVIGKGNKERIIFLPWEDPYFQKVFKDHLLERQNRVEEFRRRNREGIAEDAVFLNQYGRRMAIRDVQRLLEKYRSQLGMVKMITPHKLRHSYASALVREDMDVFMIKELLGHSSIATTEIYLHIEKRDIKRKMDLKKPLHLPQISN
jgi:site-specific recombinase XerD